VGEEPDAFGFGETGLSDDRHGEEAAEVVEDEEEVEVEAGDDDPSNFGTGGSDARDATTVPNPPPLNLALARPPDNCSANKRTSSFPGLLLASKLSNASNESRTESSAAFKPGQELNRASERRSAKEWERAVESEGEGTEKDERGCCGCCCPGRAGTTGAPAGEVE